MPGGNRRAGRIDQELWLASRRIRGSIFELCRGIERNVAERASARQPLIQPVIGRIHRPVQMRQWRRAGNHLKKFGGIYGRIPNSIRLWTNAFGSFRSKIRQRKPAGGGQIKTARIIRVSRAIVRAAKPIQCVLNVVRQRKPANVGFEHIGGFGLAVHVRHPRNTPLGG